MRSSRNSLWTVVPASPIWFFVVHFCLVDCRCDNAPLKISGSKTSSCQRKFFLQKYLRQHFPFRITQQSMSFQQLKKSFENSQFGSATAGWESGFRCDFWLQVNGAAGQVFDMNFASWSGSSACFGQTKNATCRSHSGLRLGRVVWTANFLLFDSNLRLVFVSKFSHFAKVMGSDCGAFVSAAKKNRFGRISSRG